MPKRRSANKKTKGYSSFQLHGSYPKQKVLGYLILDFLISVTLGVIFQPLIVQIVASVFAGS